MIPIIYDQVNGWSKADECIITLLKKNRATHIADLGCGTGRVTSKLAEYADNVNGTIQVTAIDPNTAAINYARQTYREAYNIDWLVGDSKDLQPNCYDAVIMTANVAQVFISDELWMNTLTDIYNSLRDGGQFVFDCRNALARVWEKWEQDMTPELAKHPLTAESLEIWTTYKGLEGEVFTYTDTVKLANSDIVIEQQTNQLKFRSYDTLLDDLKRCGFTHINVYENGELKDATHSADYFVFHCLK